MPVNTTASWQRNRRPWQGRSTAKEYRRNLRLYILPALGRLPAGETLNEIEAEGVELPGAITAVRLLLLTGCRLNEIMKLRWEHIDIEAAALRLRSPRLAPRSSSSGEQRST
jgi:integrase